MVAASSCDLSAHGPTSISTSPGSNTGLRSSPRKRNSAARKDSLTVPGSPGRKSILAKPLSSSSGRATLATLSCVNRNTVSCAVLGALVAHVDANLQGVDILGIDRRHAQIGEHESSVSRARARKKTGARSASRDTCWCSDPSGSRAGRWGARRRKWGSGPPRAARSPAYGRSGRHVPSQHRRSHCPPRCPRNHAASTASAFSISHGTARGRPENSTTITRLPCARARSKTASANCRCLPGSPRCARLAASPLMVAASPTHSTMASAAAHRSRAAAIPDTSSLSIATPGACSTWDSGRAARKPATTLTGPSASAAPHHGPRICAAASASGPMTASRRGDAASGSVSLSFFSITMARAPTARASRRRCSRAAADSGAAPRR